MRLNLSIRFTILIAAILLAGILGLLYFNMKSDSELLNDIGIAESKRLAAAISDQLITAMRLGGSRAENRAVIERFKRMKGIEDDRIIHGEAIDRQYGVEADEAPKDPLDMAALSGGEGQSWTGQSGRGYRTARFVMPIYMQAECSRCHPARPGEVLGAVSVTVSLQEHERMISRHKRNFLFWGVGILLGASLLVLSLVNRRLLGPLGRLREGADALARGELDFRVGIRTGDEIEGVGSAFDSMADSLLRAAEDLNALNEKYSKLVCMAPDAILLRDMVTGRYIEANPAAESLTGYARDELAGLGPADIYPAGDIPDYNEALRPWVSDGKGRLRETTVRKKDGGLMPVEIAASVIDLHGRKFIQEICRDISERKAMEETIRRHVKELEETVRSRTAELNSSLVKLEAAYRMLMESEQKLIQSAKLVSLGEMGAGIAHELNSPLAGILSITEVMLSRAGADGANRVLLEKVKDAAVRSKYIIMDMLTYARPKKEAFSPMFLNESIRATLTIFMSEIKTSGIEIIEHFDRELPRVLGNKGQVMEVVLNILKNARDAMGGHGKLYITTRSVEQAGVMYSAAEFRDTGPGIPPPIMNQIFDPFFTTKEKGGGHNIGLGLSISQSIIKEHGGLLEASNSPEGGAVFRMMIPSVKEDEKF